MVSMEIIVYANEGFMNKNLPSTSNIAMLLLMFLKVLSGMIDIRLFLKLRTLNRGIDWKGSPWIRDKGSRTNSKRFKIQKLTLIPQIRLLSNFNSTNQSNPLKGEPTTFFIALFDKSRTSRFRAPLNPVFSMFLKLFVDKFK